jgi:anaerobic selenocysteine-containing dehydrogenase
MDNRERYEKIFEKLPNKRIQLYNSVLEKEGVEPLPEYRGEQEDPFNEPVLHNEYPLIFTDEHSAYLNHHSWMKEIPWLREIQKHPQAKINPVTARRYGIRDGDWVEIVSPHGMMKAEVILFPGIRPDMIMGQHGWGQNCDPLDLPELSVLEGGVNPNNLYDWERRDPLTGSITKNTLVRIKRAEPPKGTNSFKRIP